MHDVIVIGARCAGAPTAMLLAQKGYKVLLVDRATFPSDIPHGHFIHRHGPRRLARWGLIDRIVATNCPPVTSCVMDLGDFPLVGTGLTLDGVALGYGPRRSALDTVLVDAAVEAGVELRTGFVVDGFTTDGDRITGIRGRAAGGGRPVTESASVVVGADGRHSRLARFVGAPEYETFPPVACWYFSYWSGVPDRGIGIYVRRDKAVFVFPTNDSLLGVFVGWPIDRLAAVRADINGHVMAALDEVPELSAHVRAGRREERFRGASDIPNFYRKPYGPGWALVGDAGCHKDPYLALGICDALRDVEFLVEALDDGLSGRRRVEDALQDYERRRNDASAADYRENLHLAQFKPPAEDVFRLRAALRGDPAATRQFFLARNEMIPREGFFNPENLQRLGLRPALPEPPTPREDTRGGRLQPAQGAQGRLKAAPTTALWCLLLLLLLPHSGVAQARLTGSDLSGRVTDESGAVLPDATVMIVNVDTNVARDVRTDASGRFHAPALVPGTYRIVVERAGFAPQTLEGTQLLLGQSAVLDVVMTIAGAREVVTVIASTAGVDAAKTAVSSVVGSQQIENLPINLRNFISFSIITPGATTDRTPQQGALTTSGLSFTGQRARSNNIMVDGLDNNDISTGSVGATFSQEAIREFQVLTSSYSAEFGKASAGVVNIVTRSGTNTPHGSGFLYYRNESLNAKDHFETLDRFGEPIERDKAPFRQRQWGGVLGGPIRRDRTFFFLSFERADITASNFVNIDPGVADVLAANGFPVELGNVPYEADATELLGKIDHQFSSASALVARANVSDTANENIEPFGGIVARSRGAVQTRRDWSLAGSHTYAGPGWWVNETRAQFARQHVEVIALDPNCRGRCDDPFEGGPTLELPGVASVGRQRFTPQRRRNDRYQILDTVSAVLGGHSIKGGFEFNHMRTPVFELPLHFGGRFIFSALPANPAFGLTEPISAVQALSLGLPATYVQGYGTPSSAYDYDDLSAFLQDEWKIGSRVTIKPGIRYQKQFWPHVHFDVSNVGGGRFEYDWPQDSNNIAPRLALAIDPSGTGRTAIHAAYGRYYDHHITGNVAVGRIVDGSSGVRTFAARFPASIAAWQAPGHRLPEPSTAFPSVEIAIDPALETPVARHLSAGVDRELGRDLSVSASLVSVRGQHQLGTIDFNPIVPPLGAGRRPNDVDNRPGTSASILQYTSFGETWYKGLIVSLNKRFGHNSQFLAAYTLSKADDTSTDFQSVFMPENSGRGRNPADPTGLPLGFDPRRERGSSSQDQRHRLVVSGLYQFPFDIQVSAVITAASGRPFTALAGADLNGDGDGGAFPPDRARRDPANPETSVGRHSETMPSQVSADVRLSKRFTVRDRMAVVAMIEAFNLFDRVNFSEVNNIFGRGAFPDEPQRDAQGRVTYGRFEQALPPRQVQLGMRVTF